MNISDLFYDPELYDLEVGVSYGRAARWELYSYWAKKTGGPVLELGSGTGQIASAIATQGVDVLGLDCSEMMLTSALATRTNLNIEVQKRIEYIHGDMRTFNLNRSFSAVFIPYHAFFHLLTIEDIHACLSCIRKHLHPQGFLVFDIYVFSAAGWDLTSSGHSIRYPRLVGETAWPSRSGYIRVTEEVSFNPVTQIQDTDFRYELLNENREVKSVWYRQLKYRIASLEEIRLHLQICGFTNIEMTAYPTLGNSEWLILANC